MPYPWEQRKLGDIFEEYSEKKHPELPPLTIVQGGGTILRDESNRQLQYDKNSLSGYKMVNKDDFIVHLRSFEGGLEISKHTGLISPAYHTFHGMNTDSRFYYPYFRSYDFINRKLTPHVYGIRDGRSIDIDGMKTIKIPYPSHEEQKRIGDFLESLDNLITFHQCNKFWIFSTERNDFMADLEAVLEERLIHQLCSGESQWTYRPDITTDEALWANFKYILEQNNKAKLNGTPLSEAEFAKVKNDVSHATFYDAGKWLSGENGIVYVHVQRGNELLHLVVINNEHIAGGTSTYEVINQYQAFKLQDDDRDRRFDVTLLINGLPLIHIELKNKTHSYMDGFYQIKKYIAEGKFRGLFSNVQMFIVSNEVETKYFSAARDTDLNKKFITGWVNRKNEPVINYLQFAEQVLRIPQAHEMVTKYTVLDNDKRALLILRPYQIHAIEAVRAASKQCKSGFIWHTTGSGKTMTSYKATRNLLMDIPSIDKTIFLIDRKDLDTQTKMAFQSYADNDTIDVDETDNVNELKKRLMDGNRTMIVTTRQKMQILIDRRLKEGTKEYDKIRNLRLAFVVDECHRAVSPQTKRSLERFFNRSLWYGFTGTPIFTENKYEAKGDLPQTTEELYGPLLHSYTIKEALHDGAVLGFMVENLGSKAGNDDLSVYDTKTHMRQVLDVILNKARTKFGIDRPKGKSYEAILTVKSIARAQQYYELLSQVKAGNDELKIDESITKTMPDFPKFAITYSVQENKEDSSLNQDKMKQSIADYNEMFGTNYKIEAIGAYNGNLNDRLARKESRYHQREEQLDLVIVVDRLLTGFDAPSMSTLFMDRQPMSPQDLIQAFSRTNRLLDDQKMFGQIVTFQSPDDFKEAIDHALTLYSLGGEGAGLAENWEDVLHQFIVSLKAVQVLGKTPEEISALSVKQKRAFLHLFRALDHDFAHLKAFTTYDESILKQYDFSQEQYEDYAGVYKNIVEELKTPPDDPDNPPDEDPPIEDYDLIAFNKIRVDFEYIVILLQGLVDTIHMQKEALSQTAFEANMEALRKEIDEYSKENPQVADMLYKITDEIVANPEKYQGQDMSYIINHMCEETIDALIDDFAKKWYLDVEDVRYEVYHFSNGEMNNETLLKEKMDYATYKESTEGAMSKLKFRREMVQEFKTVLMAEIAPLLKR